MLPRSSSSVHDDGEAEPFLHLYMLLPFSPSTERQREYCTSLQLNAVNTDVNSIHLLSDRNLDEMSGMLAACRLRATRKAGLRPISLHSGIDMTYESLLRLASANSSRTRLHVVANSDLVLGKWSALGGLRGCLSRIYQRSLAFALSRWEPASCYPLDGGQPRQRTSSTAPDHDTYVSICPDYLHARRSRDALAFNRPIRPKALTALRFPPNRLGAENLLSCILSSVGYFLYNPCVELPVFHNHCSDVRSYTKTRIDANITIIDGKVVHRSSLRPNGTRHDGLMIHRRINGSLKAFPRKWCRGHLVEPTTLNDRRVCGEYYASRAFDSSIVTDETQSGARLRTRVSAHCPNPWTHACKGFSAFSRAANSTLNSMVVQQRLELVE